MRLRMKPMHPRRRLQRIIDQTAQSIIDATYWQSLHPNDPLDIEVERVLHSLAVKAAELWDAGKREEYMQASDRMYQYAVKNC